MARSWVSMCFLSLKDTTLLCAVPGPSTLPTPGCTFSPGFDLHLIILQNSADTPVLLAVFPDLPRLASASPGLSPRLTHLLVSLPYTLVSEHF